MKKGEYSAVDVLEPNTSYCGRLSASMINVDVAGFAALRARAELITDGFHVTVYSNIQPIYVSRDLYPPSRAEDIFGERVATYLLSAFAGGHVFGGVDVSGFVPRPVDVDFVILENIKTGEVAVLTRQEIIDNAIPKFTKKAIVHLKAEYEFPSKQALYAYMKTLSPYVDAFINESYITSDQRIDLSIPYAALHLARSQSTVLVERTAENRIRYHILIYSGGIPVIPIVAGAAILAAIGIGAYSLYRIDKLEAAVHEQAEATRKSLEETTKTAEEQNANLIMSLRPEALLVPKEQLLAENRKTWEAVRVTINERFEEWEKNLPDHKPGISLGDKLKYGAIGAGVGLMAYLLLGRGAQAAAPIIIRERE